MITLMGDGMDVVVLDGEWLEELRGAESVMRAPAARFRGMEGKETTRRTKLFRGEKE